MIVSCSKTARRAAAVFIFLLCSPLVLTADHAVAGYGPAVHSTQDGGGSWGAILEMSVEVNGPYARFMIRKKDGLPFNVKSDVIIKTSSWRGDVVESGSVRPGSRTVELTVRLDKMKHGQPVYACLSNSYGHAWVGPVQISPDYSYVAQPVQDDPAPYVQYPPEDYPYDSSAGTGLGRPLISEYPGKAFVSKQVDISVTAGICRQGGLVKVQCAASGSDKTLSNPYDSGWVRPGQQLNVPFRFHELGRQTISCRTLDSCCASARTGRDIEIVKKKVPPPVKKSASRTETKINISVVTDSEGRAKSNVQVESSKTESCAPFCGDGEITFDKPYLPEYRPAPEAIYPGTPEQYYDDSQL